MMGLRALFGAVTRHRQVGSAVQVIAVRGIVLGTNILTGMLSAAMLGPEGRGEQTAMMVGSQFIGGVSEFGLHASLIYNIKNDPRHERLYLGWALLLGAATGTIGLIAGYLLAPLWLGRYDAKTVSVARLLLCVVPVGAVSHMMMGALEARGRFGPINRRGLMTSCATLAALAVLWQFGLLTPATSAAAYMLPILPMCGMMWLDIRGESGPVPPREPRLARRLLHYGLRFYGIDILTSLGGYLDQFILVLVLDPAMVGIYVVAQSASRVLNIIPTSVAMVLFPSVAGRPAANVLELVGVTARVTTMATAASALGLGVLGPYLLELMYGARFADAVGPFRLLLIEAVLTNLSRILYQAFSAVGRPEIVSALECIGLGTSVASMLMLVPTLGTIGAAVGLLIAAVVRLICVLVGLPLILGVRPPNLVLGRADIRRVMGR